MGLVFQSRLWSYFFCPFTTFLIICSFYFFYFLYICIYDSGLFPQIFFRDVFQSAVRGTILLQSVTPSRLGDQPKSTKSVLFWGPVRAVMWDTYSTDKHLCIFIFRVVSHL